MVKIKQNSIHWFENLHPRSGAKLYRLASVLFRKEKGPARKQKPERKNDAIGEPSLRNSSWRFTAPECNDPLPSRGHTCCEDCFYYCSERNNVVVLFGTLKVLDLWLALAR